MVAHTKGKNHKRRSVDKTIQSHPESKLTEELF